MGTGRKKGPGGGGTALNFKVVGNPQPASPKENTIWVNTDVKIPNWYFSATQPENMAEGDVWISIGTKSTVEFNVLKKNCIMVYPIYAKQYISGAWADKTAKSYQNGEWVEWIKYLYNNGMFSEISGFNTVRSSVQNSNRKLTIVSNINEYSMVYSKEKISINGNSKILFTIENGTRFFPWDYSVIGLSLDVPSQDRNSGVVSGLVASQNLSKYPGAGWDEIQDTVQIEFDISGISNGKYYFVISFASNSSSNGTLIVSSIVVQ